MVPHAFPTPCKEFAVDLWASMEPTREVGGDLYDFFRTEDGRLCFLVGDVSNKGMPAALFMARAKSLIRVAAHLMRSPDGASASPADIVTRVKPRALPGQQRHDVREAVFRDVHPRKRRG